MAIIQQTPIGRSDAFHQLMDAVSDAASLDRPVLVMGERGSGKALIAARLHFLSPRWEQSFLSLSCAAYDGHALDALLFGGETDSGHYNDGLFTRSDEGTLYLGDIDHVPLTLQRKMLEAFESGVIDPLDGSEPATVNVRVIASTSVDLRSSAAHGRFDPELLDYLGFSVIGLPPLRGRADDIAALAEHFGRKMAAQLGADSFAGFTPEALDLLSRQTWSGNVRELRAVVERSLGQAYLQDASLSEPIARLVLDAFAGISPLAPAPATAHAPAASPSAPIASPQSAAADTAAGGVLPDTLPKTGEPAAQSAAPQSLQDRVSAYERRLIDDAMNEHAHHQGKAAEALGLSYHGFRGLLRKHGLKK